MWETRQREQRVAIFGLRPGSVEARLPCCQPTREIARYFGLETYLELGSTKETADALNRKALPDLVVLVALRLTPWGEGFRHQFYAVLDE